MSRLIAICTGIVLVGGGAHSVVAVVRADAPGRRTPGRAAPSAQTSHEDSSAQLNFGACCLPDGACLEHLSRSECEVDAGGHFLGRDTTCPDVCPCFTDEECDDNDLCTYDDRCIDNVCFYKPTACDVGESCDPETGLCTGCSPPPGGCSDGLFCNGLEAFDEKTCECVAGPGPCITSPLVHCDEANDRCVECLIDKHCNDDDSCTTDSCVDGQCVIDPVLCPDNQGCDPADGVCRFCANTPPDMCCNPADGLMVPIDDGSSCTVDTCLTGGIVEHLPLASPPLAEAIGSRSIAVTPQPDDSDHPVGLHLSSPNFPCLSRYLDPDGTIVDEPIFLTPAEWGTVVATRQDIVPSAANNPTIYEIRAVCDPVDQDTTDPAVAIPFVWGDVNDDRIVDGFDLLCVLDGFAGIFVNCSFVAANLTPCVPDDIIDLFDIVAILDAFTGQPFPCAAPCGGGACCEPGTTVCLQLPPEECDAQGWLFQGQATHCRINPCRP